MLVRKFLFLSASVIFGLMFSPTPVVPSKGKQVPASKAVSCTLPGSKLKVSSFTMPSLKMRLLSKLQAKAPTKLPQLNLKPKHQLKRL
ncbi:hypothetical protein ALP25_200141 [Pseudomonas syringae pv. syringae]|nr:hypothetical protein ALP25_200141 [Pseudomonas syringae pv. syringae]